MTRLPGQAAAPNSWHPAASGKLRAACHVGPKESRRAPCDPRPSDASAATVLADVMHLRAGPQHWTPFGPDFANQKGTAFGFYNGEMMSSGSGDGAAKGVVMPACLHRTRLLHVRQDACCTDPGPSAAERRCQRSLVAVLKPHTYVHAWEARQHRVCAMQRRCLTLQGSRLQQRPPAGHATASSWLAQSSVPCWSVAQWWQRSCWPAAGERWPTPSCTPSPRSPLSSESHGQLAVASGVTWSGVMSVQLLRRGDQRCAVACSVPSGFWGLSLLLPAAAGCAICSMLLWGMLSTRV